MRTVTDATLYIVNGPHGPYFAIRDNDSGEIITERTEQAAAVIANEKDMLIVDRIEITHAKLLAVSGFRGGVAFEDGVPTFSTTPSASASRSMHREPHAPTR